MEIERKFLMRGCPLEAQHVAPLVIAQGWIPGTAIRERLRRTEHPDGTVTWHRTIKLGAGVSRIEVEESVPPELFEAMWPLTSGSRVRKHRHVVPDGAFRWEIDVFTDRELVLAEIELDAVETPVSIPSWLAPFVVREVTGDPAYVNANLARPDPSLPDSSAC